jgi:hypothetical protein
LPILVSGWQAVTKVLALKTGNGADVHFCTSPFAFMSSQEPLQGNRMAQRIGKELDRLYPGPSTAAVTSMTELPKTSAIVLNWSRFSNVLIIVASMSRIEGIDEILIWNNNPKKLFYEASP